MSPIDLDALLAPLPPIDMPRDAGSIAAAGLNLDASPGFLANHAFRSYAFAAWFGQFEAIAFDAGALWVASVLHDIGLTDTARADACFEVDGADAAAAFLRGRGADDATIDVVRQAIVLHMQPSVDREAGDIAWLLDAGVSCDVSGRRYEEVDADFLEAVVERFPRLDFKRRFTALIGEEAERKPDCMAATYMNEFGLAARIAAAPFRE